MHNTLTASRKIEGGGFVDFSKGTYASELPVSERRGVVSVFHQLHCLVRDQLPFPSFYFYFLYKELVGRLLTLFPL